MSDSITTLLRNPNSSSKSWTAVRNFVGQGGDDDDDNNDGGDAAKSPQAYL